MEIVSVLYILYSNTSVIILIGLALLFWSRRQADGAKSMAFMMALAALWGLSDLLSDLSRDLSVKIFWDHMSYFGVVLIPVGWLIFTLKYTKRDKYLRGRNFILLSIMPALTLFMVWTSDFHHMMISESRLIKIGQLTILDTSFGWWFWLHAVYSYALLVQGMVLLVRKLFKMPRILRNQTILIITAILVPLIGDLLYITGINPSIPIDPATFLFTVTGVLCFWGLFRHKLFDLIPAARNAVIEDMSTVLIVVDNEYHIIDINEAAKILFDYFEKDFIGRPAAEILGEWAQNFKKYKYFPSLQERVSIETKYGPKHYDLKITPLLDKRKKAIGKFVTLYDITALEEAIEDSEKSRKAAETANKAKSKFLAAMSHEIRTPLNGIIGMTELLATNEHSQEETEYLQLVRGCADSLLDIINDILDFSKIEAEKMELEKRSFNLRSLIDETVKTFLHQKREKQIELIYTMDGTLPENLVGDPFRIRQILVNLIGNAFKFTEFGKIEVTAELLSVAGQQAVVRVSVSDTGIGVPEDKVKDLFKSFEQVDSSTTRKYGGTGLGLAIVKSLVTMMGGTIEVESELGAGSRFFFTVPFRIPETVESGAGANGAALPEAAAEAEAEAGAMAGAIPEAAGRPAASPEISSGSRDIDVLLAEDNRANQILMVKLLEKIKLNVDVADNGELVLARLKEKHYDLILMDIQMPVMDGYEAALAIRSSEAESGGHIPIIALTANATEEDRNRCLQTGMDDYLTKPVKSEKLYDCLYKHIKYIKK